MKNFNLFPKSILSLFLLLTINSCKDLDDTITIPDAEDIIQKDDELFTLIGRVTASEDDPLTDIVCIDFIYPINLVMYNSSLQPIGSVTVIGDSNFSALLGTLSPGTSLSISYPISTTLADGTEFTVNNNSELKIAIDSCSREDIIAYCGGLFASETSSCVWKVAYDALGSNKYLSGYFDVNLDGTIKLFYNNQTYNGSWAFLFVNDELHMNINLEGTSQVATDWNINRKAIFNGDQIIIQDTKDIHLKKSYQETVTYAVGDLGPAGGIVFYDKGIYSDGWRYAEAAQADLAVFEWGCASTSVTGAQSSAIGKGFYNSGALLNFHDSLVNFYGNPAICDASNNGTVAAKEAIRYQLNNTKDWFLPSENELALLYANLHQHSLGNFANGVYWSSTENDATTVKTIDFSTGLSVLNLKVPATNTIKTRCIRYF